MNIGLLTGHRMEWRVRCLNGFKKKLKNKIRRENVTIKDPNTGQIKRKKTLCKELRLMVETINGFMKNYSRERPRQLIRLEIK